MSENKTAYMFVLVKREAEYPDDNILGVFTTWDEADTFAEDYFKWEQKWGEIESEGEDDCYENHYEILETELNPSWKEENA